MNISKIITFLVVGVLIGAILFFAGFGVMNLFKSDKEAIDVPAATVEESTPSDNVPQAVPVNPPKIEVTSSGQSTGAVASGETLQGEGTNSSPFRIKPLSTNANDSQSNESEEITPPAFGTLTLSTVNVVNNAPVNADFLIENSDSVAIALIKDTPTSTLSLPVGDYKITVSQGEQKVVRFLGVKDGRNGSEIFELDVPILADEPASPIIAGGDSEAPIYKNADTNAASEDSSEPSNPTNSDTASTTQQQAAPTNTNTAPATADVANPVVAGTNSANESANDANSNPSVSENNENSQASRRVGGLRLSALTKQGKRPTSASFFIQRLNGQNVETIRNVKTHQLTLPAGKYKVTAKTNKASLVKQVEVLATRGVHEIFLLSDKSDTEKDSATTTATSQGSAAQNNNSNAASDDSDNKPDKKKTGQLELFAQKATNNSAVKSNFYVQLPNGTMVASKVYVDSIGYKLPAGKYKVIVRATGYKNKSITLTVREGQTRREVFKLESVNSTPAAQQPAQPSQQPSAQRTAPATSANQNSTRAYGGLTVNIVAVADGAPLVADMIVISQRDGTLVKQANGVSSASFDLPPREFLIRVSFGGLTTNHQVNILTGRLAIKTISFDTDRLARQERRRLRRERRNR